MPDLTDGRIPLDDQHWTLSEISVLVADPEREAQNSDQRSFFDHVMINMDNSDKEIVV